MRRAAAVSNPVAAATARVAHPWLAVRSCTTRGSGRFQPARVHGSRSNSIRDAVRHELEMPAKAWSILRKLDLDLML